MMVKLHTFNEGPVYINPAGVFSVWEEPGRPGAYVEGPTRIRHVVESAEQVVALFAGAYVAEVNS